MKIKKILVSQPESVMANKRSPYHAIREVYGIDIDFRSFIKIESVSGQEFRKSKVRLPGHTAVILASRNAVDHFFRLCNELRFTIPNTMKYFCKTEAIALYLQKYIVYRKRKIFFGNGTYEFLVDLIAEKHPKEKLLLTSGEGGVILDSLLTKKKLDFTPAKMFQTASEDLSDVDIESYDMLVFFTPMGVKSLFDNFPKFEQKGTAIAAFGKPVQDAIKEFGLTYHIEAPTKEAPSMTMAIERHLKTFHPVDGAME